MMDPDYELFAIIVDSGGLSTAARALGLSPAMISKRLQRLELRLGVRLLHRSTRRNALTPAGEELYHDLQRILAELKAAEERVRGDAVFPAGPLRISAPTSFGRMHIAPYLANFLDRYPDVDLTLDLSDDFIDIMAGQVDVAIRITDVIPAGLTAHRLAVNERVLCASPAYLAQYGEPGDVAALTRHRLLAASGQLPWKLVGPQGRVTIEGISHVRTNSSEVVRELTIAGAGIALRSIWDVTDALHDGRLHRILPQLAGSRDIAIHAIHPRNPLPRAATTGLIEFLRGVYTPGPPWSRPPADRSSSDLPEDRNSGAALQG